MAGFPAAMKALVLTLCLAGSRAVAETGYPTLPPFMCGEGFCRQFGMYSNNLPREDLDPTQLSSWTTPEVPPYGSNLMRSMGQYKGQYNPFGPNGEAPFSFVPTKPNNFDEWNAQRGSFLWGLNFDKFAYEPSMQFEFPGDFNLGTCCDKCRVSPDCAMWRFEPATKKCFRLVGGSRLGYGPYDLDTQQEIGQPPVDPSMPVYSYLGGYCNPRADVTDDPHFTGAHGVRFDFNGQLGTAYCLVTDKTLHINALLDGYESPGSRNASRKTRSWIKELGFIWGKGRTLRLVARSGKQQERGAQGFVASALVDGEAVALPTSPLQDLVSGDLRIAILGVKQRGAATRLEMERYSLRLGGVLVATLAARPAHPLLQSPESAHVHFNLMINDIQASSSVHGVLGQTYRSSQARLDKAARYSSLVKLLGRAIQADGSSGRGFLDGEVGDYVASSVLRADCKVAAFHPL